VPFLVAPVQKTDGLTELNDMWFADSVVCQLNIARL
jgi:hypothetical protein